MLTTRSHCAHVPSSTLPISWLLLLLRRTHRSEQRGEETPTLIHEAFQEWRLLILTTVTLPWRLSWCSFILWERWPFLSFFFFVSFRSPWNDRSRRFSASRVKHEQSVFETGETNDWKHPNVYVDITLFIMNKALLDLLLLRLRSSANSVAQQRSLCYHLSLYIGSLFW